MKNQKFILVLLLLVFTASCTSSTVEEDTNIYEESIDLTKIKKRPGAN